MGSLQGKLLLMTKVIWMYIFLTIEGYTTFILFYEVINDVCVAGEGLEGFGPLI